MHHINITYNTSLMQLEIRIASFLYAILFIIYFLKNLWRQSFAWCFFLENPFYRNKSKPNKNEILHLDINDKFHLNRQSRFGDMYSKLYENRIIRF